MQEVLLEVTHNELNEICDALESRLGIRFHHYARASLKRRIERFINLKNRKPDSLIKEIKKSSDYAQQVVNAITVNVTEMFRNPEFFAAMQKEVFPHFQKAESISCWHAGCSSGEEVYSLAILLQEHGLLKKSKLTGWDLNPEMIAKAQRGSISERQLNAFLDAYFLANGQSHLQDYFTTRSGVSFLHPEIIQSCCFEAGNILNMKNPEDFDMILCRNTLIYFDLALQDEVVKVFYENLKPGGFLCLGEKESIRFTSFANRFEELDPVNKIFQKRIDDDVE